METRDLNCIFGTIAGVTPERLTVELHISSSSGSPETLTITRADVLHVSSGRVVYYSGRSSWLDVSSLRIAGRERLEIVTKAGKTYKVRPPYEVSDQGITLQSSEESTKISKSEIAQVYDVVVKPLTANGEYLAEELGPMIIFDRDLYVYALHREHYVPVLLYNSSDPEDDFPMQCVWR